MSTTATAIQNRLRKAYPDLLINVGRADSAVLTLAPDVELEGSAARAYVVDVTADRGTFTETIPADGMSAEGAYLLLRMYADDLNSDQADERARIAETIAATGANR